jgi:O-antigen/teichoic acid export membrane protein
MAEGRLARFAGGLGLGYLHTLAVLVVALWLTPFLLRQLGSHDYGLWLLASQVLAYLALMDLGVVALVPREVAFAAGQQRRQGVDGACGSSPDVGGAIGRTMALVAWQTPLVGLAAGAAVWLLPAEWEPLRRPFAIVATGFVVTFPLRVFTALLQGLQDLTFVGATQLGGWAAGTVTTVGLAVAGFGLYALAAGWVVSQLIPALLAWRRLALCFPFAFPRRARLPWIDVRQQLGRGSWISVGQVAQVLLSGTDLIVVGKLLGPEAIVPYACTGKLIAMLANQPQLFMQMALPALSELRGSAGRDRLFQVSRSMTQLMLLASGAIFAVVLVVNGAFVDWWVGESRFGGTALTALLLGSMLVRHINVTMVYTLFCFGYERRLAFTPIADGLVGLTAMVLLVPRFGAHGAAAGLLLAALLVSLPANLRALAREENTSPWACARGIAPWCMRCAGVLAVTIALTLMLRPRGLAFALPLAAGVVALYAAVMMPVLRAAPLGPMLAARLRPWLDRLPRMARRLAIRGLESPAA